MNDETLQNLEQLFLALSDRTRLRLVGLMANGEVSVSYLAEQTGESQPKISRHLAYLRDCGVVTTRRDGKWIYYAITDFADFERAGIIESVLSASLHSERRTSSKAVIREVEANRNQDRREAEEMEVFLL